MDFQTKYTVAYKDSKITINIPILFLISLGVLFTLLYYVLYGKKDIFDYNRHASEELNRNFFKNITDDDLLEIHFVKSEDIDKLFTISKERKFKVKGYSIEPALGNEEFNWCIVRKYVLERKDRSICFLNDPKSEEAFLSLRKKIFMQFSEVDKWSRINTGSMINNEPNYYIAKREEW